jgi:lysozyme
MALADRLADYRRFEGRSLVAYQDSGGIWTIGYGHTPARLGQTCALAQAEAWLAQDDEAAQAQLDADPAWSGPRWTWRSKLDDARQDAVIELAFNLGERTLDDFRVFRGALEGGDYAAAEAALIDSAWYDEVNGDGRGDFIGRLVLTGARPS